MGRSISKSGAVAMLPIETHRAVNEPPLLSPMETNNTTGQPRLGWKVEVLANLTVGIILYVPMALESPRNKLAVPHPSITMPERIQKIPHNSVNLLGLPLLLSSKVNQ